MLVASCWRWLVSTLLRPSSLWSTSTVWVSSTETSSLTSKQNSARSTADCSNLAALQESVKVSMSKLVPQLKGKSLTHEVSRGHTTYAHSSPFHLPPGECCRRTCVISDRAISTVRDSLHKKTAHRRFFYSFSHNLQDLYFISYSFFWNI